MFRLDRLASLAAVRRLGTLAAAAQSLHLTPSAVSQQLTALEREVGVPLLIPHGRGVRLTPAAQILADSAESVLAELDAARVRVAELDGAVAGTVTVASVPTALSAFVLEALDVLRAENRSRAGESHAVVPVVIEAEPDQSLPAVLAGEVDVAVVESWHNLPVPRTAGTDWTWLHEEDIGVALPAGHPAAEQRQVCPADLADLDWVAWTEGSRAHQCVEHTLAEWGMGKRIRHHVTGYTTQYAMVARLGVAALTPRMAAMSAPPEVRLVRVDPPLRRSLYAVTAAGFPRATVHATVAAIGRSAQALTAIPAS